MQNNKTIGKSHIALLFYDSHLHKNSNAYLLVQLFLSTSPWNIMSPVSPASPQLQKSPNQKGRIYTV